MASIISAGTTSGTSLNLSGDTSGVLQLASNGSTTAVTIDTSQNVGIGTASPVARLQAVGTDGTAGGTNTLLRLLGNIGGTNKSGGLFFRTLNSTTVGTERIALIQSTDVDNNDRVLALNSTGGNVLIGTTTNNASGGVLQVSNGITFPATQSASSDANTLDDYEEGTWTATVYTGGIASQSCSYTKIGRAVTISGLVVYNGASVDPELGGLPFTSANTHDVAVAVYSSGMEVSSGGPVQAFILKNTTRILFYSWINNSLGSAYQSSGEVSFNCTYFV
jgi:hypothetical protein